MKYKTLFRLTLKAFGVLAIVIAVPEVAQYSVWVLYNFAQPRPVGQISSWYQLLRVVGPLLQLLLGVYLFFGGNWIVNLAIPGNRPYCHECGYDLRHVTANRCPECDTPFQPADVAPPSQAKHERDT